MTCYLAMPDGTVGKPTPAFALCGVQNEKGVCLTVNEKKPGAKHWRRAFDFPMMFRVSETPCI